MTSGDSKDTEDNKFMYYDVEEHKWKKLGKLTPFPYSPSFLVAEGCLFAIGGIHKTPIFWIIEMKEDPKDEYAGIKRMDFYCAEEHNFQQYTGKEWVDDLPSIPGRYNLSPVYLDGSIYVIGGENYDSSRMLTSVQCYNIAKREWKDVAPLPDEFTNSRVTSALAYQGNILTYIVGSGKQLVLVYDPSEDVWQTKLTEDYGGMKTPDPILFLHNDVCYRVFSTIPYQSLYDFKDVRCRPTVNILEIGEDFETVSVGKEISQDLIPVNKVGAFRIESEVFLNVKGFMYKTDIKIRDGRKGNVNLSKWKNVGELKNRQSNIVNFTFDVKKLTNQYEDDDYY